MDEFTDEEIEFIADCVNVAVTEYGPNKAWDKLSASIFGKLGKGTAVEIVERSWKRAREAQDVG